MTKTYSRYNIFGGFGLLILINGLIGFLTFKLLTVSKVSYDKVDLLNDSNALLLYSIIIGLNVISILLLMSQAKFVVTDKSGITFINPLIPILRKKRLWTDFDYFITVEEYSRYSTYEAVWLIEDEKVKGRFSSFYYSNFQDLKRQIKANDKGKCNLSQVGQMLAVMGLKKVKVDSEYL